MKYLTRIDFFFLLFSVREFLKKGSKFHCHVLSSFQRNTQLSSMTSNAAKLAPKDMTPLSPDEAYTLAKSLKKGDLVEIWFRQGDEDPWTLWNGKTIRSVADASKDGTARYAWIQYTGEKAPPDVMLQFPQDPAICVYGAGSRIVTKDVKQPKKEFIALKLDAEDAAEDSGSDSDDSSETVAVKMYDPEDLEIMLDPARWHLVLRERSDAKEMARAFKDRYENVASGTEAHSVKWMLKSLKGDMKGVVKRPSYCADETWVQARQDLIGRLHLLHQKKAGMSNEMLAALDNAIANRKLPVWLQEASKQAMDSQKALAFKSGGNQAPNAGNQAKKGKGKKGKDDNAKKDF